MRYVLPDGHLAVGASYAAIIDQMSDGKFDPPRSRTSYRRAVARRVHEMYNKDVDASTDKTLVQSLVSVGLLIRVPV